MTGVAPLVFLSIDFFESCLSEHSESGPGNFGMQSAASKSLKPLLKHGQENSNVQFAVLKTTLHQLGQRRPTDETLEQFQIQIFDAPAHTQRVTVDIREKELRDLLCIQQNLKNLGVLIVLLTPYPRRYLKRIKEQFLIVSDQAFLEEAILKPRQLTQWLSLKGLQTIQDGGELSTVPHILDKPKEKRSKSSAIPVTYRAQTAKAIAERLASRTNIVAPTPPPLPNSNAAAVKALLNWGGGSAISNISSVFLGFILVRLLLSFRPFEPADAYSGASNGKSGSGQTDFKSFLESLAAPIKTAFRKGEQVLTEQLADIQITIGDLHLPNFSAISPLIQGIRAIANHAGNNDSFKPGQFVIGNLFSSEGQDSNIALVSVGTASPLLTVLEAVESLTSLGEHFAFLQTPVSLSMETTGFSEGAAALLLPGNAAIADFPLQTSETIILQGLPFSGGEFRIPSLPSSSSVTSVGDTTPTQGRDGDATNEGNAPSLGNTSANAQLETTTPSTTPNDGISDLTLTGGSSKLFTFDPTTRAGGLGEIPGELPGTESGLPGDTDDSEPNPNIDLSVEPTPSSQPNNPPTEQPNVTEQPATEGQSPQQPTSGNGTTTTPQSSPSPIEPASPSSPISPAPPQTIVLYGGGGSDLIDISPPSQTTGSGSNAPGTQQSGADLPSTTTADSKGQGTQPSGSNVSIPQGAGANAPGTSAPAASTEWVIHDFGGVGTGSSPSAQAIAEVDTLQLNGSQFAPANLSLSQVGRDVLLTFANIPSFSIRLTDFSLENFDNLVTSSALTTVGNIRFSGDKGIRDHVDVFNRDWDISGVMNPNTVTFLNDRDNQVWGRQEADNVINGQGGNDQLTGGDQDDLLRGEDGDDILTGNRGQNWLVGGGGQDLFKIHTEGFSTVADFNPGADRIRVNRGLGFADLTFELAEVQDFTILGSNIYPAHGVTFGTLVKADAEAFLMLPGFSPDQVRASWFV